MPILRSIPSLPTHLLRRFPVAVRSFHSSRPTSIKVGDRIPNLAEALVESSPGNKVNLAEELGGGRALIIGVPAAFSPSCSSTHIPGYVSHPNISSAGKVFVVSVNDAFVMKAWAATLDPTGKSGIRFLADPSGEFTSALDLAFTNKGIFGEGVRSKRYALEVEGGKVVVVHVEPDGTGVDVSRAEKVLG